MPRREVTYELGNFFLDRRKVMFFLRLGDIRKHKIKFYNLCKENNISQHHGKLILKGFKSYGLINYDYDKEYFSDVVRYTRKGIKLKNKLEELRKIIVGLRIW